MTKRITLLKPGGRAWVVTETGDIPAAFQDDLRASAIKDVPDESGTKRHHIAVDTFAGPVHVLVGHYLIKTDNGQVFGMVPEQFPEVWKVIDEPLPGEPM